jgi:hypothetical protein
MQTIKGGKDDRDRAARLRKRVKRGGKLEGADADWMAAWEAHVASMPKGRPPKTDQQSAPETGAEGGGDKASSAPPDLSAGAAPPPADTTPPLEPPPRVAAPPPAASAAGDWRDAHRKRVNMSEDGRQMLCEMLAEQITDGLGALVDEMKRAEVTPMIDPRLVKSLYVLALDEIMPQRARMTPKLGAVLVTTATVGQRFYHHKKITEALKDDPDVIAWKREQAAREAKEQAQRAANQAEVAKAKEPPPEVKYAEPPPPPDEPPPTLNGRRKRVPLTQDDGKALL